MQPLNDDEFAQGVYDRFDEDAFGEMLQDSRIAPDLLEMVLNLMRDHREGGLPLHRYRRDLDAMFDRARDYHLDQEMGDQ